MTHTFLIDVGRWTLEGYWLERDGVPIPIKGKTLVGWSRDDWFTVVTKLSFVQDNLPDKEGRPEIVMQYRGHLGGQSQKYTFVLQHSLLGRVEGEGWVTPKSIIQRFWVLGDQERRSGFETMHRLNNERYYLSSGIMAGHHLVSTMEATLDRQLN